MKTVVIKHYTDASETNLQDLHPVLSKIYSHRKVTSKDDIDYQLKNILDFHTLKDIGIAAEIISEHIQSDKKILIVGDFDADGATSTAVAIRLLNKFGATNVNYLVPNRFDYGYGLTAELLENAEYKKPDLIITVDNGISSIDGVNYAHDLGIKVIITDHHLSAEELPTADAIVNPNQPGCDFDSKSIAGVGVIFYLMMAVRSHLRKLDWFSDKQEPNLASVLDLVALGTVADVVPLDKNNRILVDQGLKRIRSGHCCEGIKALIQVAGKNISDCCTSDIGFAIAPRLNAAGRLEDMSIGIECLLSDNIDNCNEIAEQLHQLNIERRSIESTMLEQALKELDVVIKDYSAKEIPAAIVIYNENWHQGVVGILASRIKEKFNRPVIAFAKEDNDTIKGSARSIQGLHIRDALDIIDKTTSDLIMKFGGHAMAAGLTLHAERFDEFKSRFETTAQKMLSEDDLHDVIMTDGALLESDFNLNLAETLRFSGPWGQHFPEPVFDNIFKVDEWRIVGEKHLKLKLVVPEKNQVIDAIAFNTTEERLGENCDKIRAIYKMDVNEFRNNRTLQLLIQYIEPVQ